MAIHPQTGVLIIRLWWEPEQQPALRARLLVVENARQSPVEYAVTAGLDDVIEQVRRWLQHWDESFEASGE